MKSEILQASSRLFLQYGIKSVSMEDIARELGMSKKTVYAHFETKADIVHSAIQMRLKEEEDFVSDIINKFNNPIDQFLNIQKHVSDYLRALNPSTMYDLSKYYKKTWQLFESHKSKFLFKTIACNLENGIQQKLYRNDLNADIVARIYIGGVDAFFNNNIFPMNKYKKYLTKKRAELAVI